MLKLWSLYREKNFWAQRAADLETKLETEREKRESETKRNRHFEREMISRIVTMTGQMGIANDAPARMRTPQVLPQIPLSPTEPVLNTLSPQELEDWKMYEEDAAANDISPGQAWNDFYQAKVLSKMMIEELVDVEN